jgi:hypothetical protein
MKYTKEERDRRRASKRSKLGKIKTLEGEKRETGFRYYVELKTEYN